MNAPGIHRITLKIPYPVGHVHVYLLEGDGLALVDTGVSHQALAEALAERGITPADLEAVILTHHHPDHYALAGDLEAAGAKVWMAAEELRRGHRFWLEAERWVREGAAAFRAHGAPEELVGAMARATLATRAHVRPPRQPHPLPEETPFEVVGMRFRVIPTPGHAEGQVALLREDGALLLGDAALAGISPMIARWAYSNPDPLGDYFGTLKRLEALKPTAVLPGHREPFDLGERVRAIRAHHEARLEAALEALKNGPQTAWEVSKKLFPKVKAEERRFALAETLAHLERLVASGEAVRLPEKPIRYRRSSM